MSNYESGNYWEKRSDMLYYRYIDYLMRTVASDATSMIDIGTGNCEYLEWFYWIDRRVSVDRRGPYRSDNVEGIEGDIHTLDFPAKFDVCTCFQVLEHVPDAEPFARRLLNLADRVIVSVPYEWPENSTKGHVHDPVTRDKLIGWMGRAPNWDIVVEEPSKHAKSRRLIAIYDADPRWTYAENSQRKKPHTAAMDAGQPGQAAAAAVAAARAAAKAAQAAAEAADLAAAALPKPKQAPKPKPEAKPAPAAAQPKPAPSPAKPAPAAKPRQKVTSVRSAIKWLRG